MKLSDHIEETKMEIKEEKIIGEVKMFAGLNPPKNWLICDGQSLSPVLYKNLFLVIGVKYGGDGVLKFKLPDLRQTINFIIRYD